MVSTEIACPGASTFYGLPDSYVCERNVFNLISIINMNNYFRPDVWFVTHTQGITNTTTKHGSLITVFFYSFSIILDNRTKNNQRDVECLSTLGM